jgi:putative transcriptional regulator
MAIVVRIDVELAKRKMSVGEFAERVGITPANVAVLKNGRAKAVRFSTLDAMCRVLGLPGGRPARVGRRRCCRRVDGEAVTWPRQGRTPGSG